MIDVEGLSIKVVSRPGCFRCQLIKETAGRLGIPTEVHYFNEGGSDVLAKAEFLPIIMPAIVGYKEGKVAHRWNGVSEFLESLGDLLDGVL
jgi:hypothetical protein